MLKIYDLIDLFYKQAKTITEHENIESELDDYREHPVIDKLNDNSWYMLREMEEVYPLSKYKVDIKMKNKTLRR